MPRNRAKIFYWFFIAVISLVGSVSFFNRVVAAPDTDGDGYDDETEIAAGYSPFTAEPLKLTASDIDQDGLSDYWELKFQTDAFNPDTDGDGYQDGLEVDQAFDPNASSSVRLARRLEIDLASQRLKYLVADQPWKEFVVSTGRPGMSTPRGDFKVVNKNIKAWSKTYQLWMPYWLGLGNGSFGIHELPVWPGGQREGESHLGTPVSHGCIRLGVGPAAYLFQRVDIGTPVRIK